MRIEFKNFKAKVDSNKLVVDFNHIYTPFKKHPEIKVHCDYLRNGEAMKYLDPDTGNVAMDRLFLDKVEAIEGLEIGDSKEPIKVTPQIILDLPILSVEDDPERIFSQLQALTVTHILKADSLTEDEAKN